MSNEYHTPVLLQACIELLKIKPDGVYVDLTFGGGGHSKEILKHLGEKGKLFAFDQDEDSKKNVLNDPRFTFIPQNFRFLKNYLRMYGVNKVDGVLGDLGVSSHQFDEAERGFSTRFNATLDMRMNRQNPLTAKKIVNEYDPSALKKLLKEYGEIYNAGKLVKEICEIRAEKEIVTTKDLTDAIENCTPKFEKYKYLAQIFQALRIEVNDEIESLKDCLTQCVDVLDEGGRLVFVSYHSLEDRLVKNIIKSGNTEGTVERDAVFGTSKKIFTNLTPKPILPGEAEVKQNSRARSAKLRAAEKL